jgi:hypothetical protein
MFYSIQWRNATGVFNYQESLTCAEGAKAYVRLLLEGAKEIKLMNEGRMVNQFPEPQKGIRITTKKG